MAKLFHYQQERFPPVERLVKISWRNGLRENATYRAIKLSIKFGNAKQTSINISKRYSDLH